MSTLRFNLLMLRALFMVVVSVRQVDIKMLCAIVGCNSQFRCREGGGYDTTDWDAAVG